MNVISFFNSHYSHILYLHFFGFSEMKRKLICTIFFMVAGFFWLHLVYAQDTLVNSQDTIVMGNKDLEIKGSLTVNQFFDKKNKLLTLEIKNEFNYKIMLSNPYSSPLFLLNYITEEGKEETYPYSLGLSDTARFVWVNPDSSLIINYYCEKYLKPTTRQIYLWGRFLYAIEDKQGKILVVYAHVIDDKRFDY